MLTPTLADLQTKLESVRREVRNLTVMGMDPNQTPEQTALIKDLERSARTELRLRMMALEYAKRRTAFPPPSMRPSTHLECGCQCPAREIVTRANKRSV